MRRRRMKFASRAARQTPSPPISPPPKAGAPLCPRRARRSTCSCIRPPRRGRRMRAAGTKGRKLFITSLHAETPRNIPHYAASKAGQTMVVKELARALGPAGIRINALAPGAVPGGGFNAAAFSFDGKIPLGRLGRPEALADMALALLSDRFSGYVTGTTVAVDGGIALYNWIPLPTA